MLYEYAVEPLLLNNWKDFRYFTEKFGVSRGRLISRYPKHWKRMVYESLVNCGDIEKKRIEEGIQRLDDRLVSRQSEWNRQYDWLTNAEGEHLRKPFHAILAGSNPNQRDFVLDGDSVDETHPLWNVAASRAVARNAQEMAARVALLLRTCRKVLFIDPHFGPDNPRHRRLLEAFLATALEERRSPPLGRVEIHTSDDLGSDFWMQQCKQQLPGAIPEGVSVRVVRWRQKEGGERLHNRFILTDMGGVQFGIGLDEADDSDSETDDVNLLGEDQYNRRWTQYAGPEPAFDLVDELMVEGNRLLHV